MTTEQLSYDTTFEGRSFDDVVALTTEALKERGFGIITEIDVKATMREKLDVDFRRYVILGACNPRFAHEALVADPAVGLVLPCNVIVYEEDGGRVTVSLARPEAVFRLVEIPGLASLADRVGEAIAAAHGALAAQAR